jgi:hypothetical protein
MNYIKSGAIKGSFKCTTIFRGVFISALKRLESILWHVKHLFLGMGILVIGLLP